MEVFFAFHREINQEQASKCPNGPKPHFTWSKLAEFLQIRAGEVRWDVASMETKPPPAHVFMLICVLFCHVHEVQLSILCSYTNVCCKTSVSCQIHHYPGEWCPPHFCACHWSSGRRKMKPEVEFCGILHKNKIKPKPCLKCLLNY